MNGQNSVHEVKLLSNGRTVDRRHNMFEVTQAMVMIKARFSLNEKLKRTLGSTAGITHFVFQMVQKPFWELIIYPINVLMLVKPVEISSN